MITRLRIQNFKAFRDEELNFSSLNLFTGLNGMGKSTFIQALLLLRQSDSHFIPDLVGLRLVGDIIDIGKGKDAYCIHPDGDFIGFELDYDYEKYLKVSYKFVAESDVQPFIKNNNNFNKAGNYPLFNNKFKYLKAERIGPEHTYKPNLAAVQVEGFLGYKGENAPLYLALKKLDPIYLESVKHPKAKSNTLLAHLDAWFNEITPGTHIISTYNSEYNIVKVSYQFDEGDDVTQEFSPVNVGFGFTYTFPVLLSILSAQKGDLLIIENPESHLHPQGQAKLGELLAKTANDGVQIIVESHSDHLFNGIRVAVKNGSIKTTDVSINYFERDVNAKEHITKISQPILESDGRISSKPKGFFDEYSKQLDFLLQ